MARAVPNGNAAGGVTGRKRTAWPEAAQDSGHAENRTGGSGTPCGAPWIMKRFASTAIALCMAFLLSGCGILEIFLPGSEPVPAPANPDSSVIVQPTDGQVVPGTEIPIPSVSAPIIPSQQVIGPSQSTPIQTPPPVTSNSSPGEPQQVNWNLLTPDEKFDRLKLAGESTRPGIEALADVRYGDEKSTRRFQAKMKANLPKGMPVTNFILDDGFINFIAADSESASNFVSVDAYKFQWSESSYEGNLSIQCCFDTADHSGLILQFCKTAASFGYTIDMDGIAALADELFDNQDQFINYGKSKFGQGSGSAILQVAVLQTAPGKIGVSIVISESIQAKEGETT